MTAGPDNPRDARRERERKARRLWRHYQAPAPDDVEPEVAAQQPWATYRQRQPEPPAVPATPVPGVARARSQAADRAAKRAADQASIEAGNRVLIRTLYKLFAIVALLGGVAVAGNLDADDDGATEFSQEGPDPRTAEGIEHLSDLLEEATGDDELVAAVLREDGASVSVPSSPSTGDVAVYSWSRWEPDVLSLMYASSDRGTPFELGDFDADTFAPLLSAARDRRGAGSDEGVLVVHHMAGSPVWVEITVDDDVGNDTAHATFDGELVNPE